MPDKGKYVRLELASVAGSVDKTTTYLKNLLPVTSRRTHTVLFLGETHGSAVDPGVTRYLIKYPPIIDATANNNRIIYERGLKGVYWDFSPSFGTNREESSAAGTANRARSAIMGDMVLDAFLNGINLIYLPCGSKHAVEIYDYVNKREPTSFTYLSKMDDECYGSHH